MESYSRVTSQHVIRSRLELVDLAGSERASITGSEGITRKECIQINKSLFVLRKVINNLVHKQQKRGKGASKIHIPYRDSKLTSLLKKSIGGNSFCLMIACLAPADFYIQENISTLNYATKASYISNKPVVNEDPSLIKINQ